jgi:hypothetical protein
MKVLWIGGLLSLLAIVAYDRVSAELGGAGGAMPAMPSTAAAVSQGAGGHVALTIPEYVLLHQTRSEGITDEQRSVNGQVRQ